jgi:hypothetical protein
MHQGSSHWNASRLLSGHVECDLCGGDLLGSYTDMLRAYALDLAN